MLNPIVKDSSMIGKLSSKNIRALSLSNSMFEHKNITAILPNISRVKPSMNNMSVFSQKNNDIQDHINIRSSYNWQGREQPLPRVRPHHPKLKHPRQINDKNPQQEKYVIDNKRRMISRNIGVQIDQSKVKLIGSIYSPRSQSLAEAGTIKHQNIKFEGKDLSHINNTIKNFKNFLQNEYVKDLKSRQTAKFTIIDYDFKMGSSNNSNDFQREIIQSTNRREITFQCQSNDQIKFGRYDNQRDTQDIAPVCVDKIDYDKVEEPKTEIYLHNVGKMFVQSLEIEHFETEVKSYIQFDNKNKQIVQIFYKNDILNLSNCLEINFLISPSKIKQIIIEQMQLNLSFSIPDVLLKPISVNINQPQVHMLALKVFDFYWQVKPQIISSKKFNNCILIAIKNIKQGHQNSKLALLLYFSGSFYIGEWKTCLNQNAEGFKQGIGLQYHPSNQIYYGKFVQNSRHGYGILKKANKQVYVGEWSNNNIKGWGKIFNSAGKLIKNGDFQQGRFIAKQQS